MYYYSLHNYIRDNFDRKRIGNHDTRQRRPILNILSLPSLFCHYLFVSLPTFKFSFNLFTVLSTRFAHTSVVRDTDAEKSVGPSSKRYKTHATVNSLSITT